jgi:hypothetical protein
MWADRELAGLYKANQDEADVNGWLTKAFPSASNVLSHVICIGCH